MEWCFSLFIEDIERTRTDKDQELNITRDSEVDSALKVRLVDKDGDENDSESERVTVELIDVC